MHFTILIIIQFSRNCSSFIQTEVINLL